MMQIWEVRMRMDQWVMTMLVTVRFAWRVVRPMLVLVVVIVNVAMAMCHPLVRVFVLVPLLDMQPDTCSHKHRGSEENPTNRFAEENN